MANLRAVTHSRRHYPNMAKKSPQKPLKRLKTIFKGKVVKYICLKCGYILEATSDTEAICCHNPMDKYAKWKEKYIK